MIVPESRNGGIHVRTVNGRGGQGGWNWLKARESRRLDYRRRRKGVKSEEDVVREEGDGGGGPEFRIGGRTQIACDPTYVGRPLCDSNILGIESLIFGFRFASSFGFEYPCWHCSNYDGYFTFCLVLISITLERRKRNFVIFQMGMWLCSNGKKDLRWSVWHREKIWVRRKGLINFGETSRMF